MRRRPEQQSMLKLMGADEGKPHPFEGFKLSDMVTDSNGNITSVTVVGPWCPAWPESADEDPWWDQAAPEETEQ